MGKIHIARKEFYNAISQFEKASEIARQLGDLHILVNQLNDLSIVFYDKSISQDDNSNNITIVKRAVQTAEEAVSISKNTGDRVQLANASANLAKAYLLTNDIARAYSAAYQSGRIFRELVGNSDSRSISMLSLAEKLKLKLDNDLKLGMDWKRSFTCSMCGERFPWNSQFDSSFELGMDFVSTACPTCHASFDIYKPS